MKESEVHSKETQSQDWSRWETRMMVGSIIAGMFFLFLTYFILTHW